jgi:peptidylamidoglycolate lyase
MTTTRRRFLQQLAFTAGAAIAAPGLSAASGAPNVITRRSRLGNEVVGHGDFRYRVEIGWGDLDAARYPVKNCHEMVMDRRGRLIMLGDEPRNNVLPKLSDSGLWGRLSAV